MYNPIDVELGIQIRSLCVHHSPPVTEVEIGAAIGRSQTYVSERLRGMRSFSVGDLYAIAALFGASAHDLVSYADQAVTRGASRKEKSQIEMIRALAQESAKCSPRKSRKSPSARTAAG